MIDLVLAEFGVDDVCGRLSAAHTAPMYREFLLNELIVPYVNGHKMPWVYFSQSTNRYSVIISIALVSANI